MVDSISHIGKTMYYSATLPATNDAAGFEALTWTRVTRPVQLPQFGVQHDTVTVPLLGGFNDSAKGAGDGVSTDMMFSDDVTSGTRAAGQTGIRAIADAAGGDIAIKIGKGTGADLGDGGLTLETGDPVIYAQGFVGSLRDNPISTTDYEGFTITFKQRAPTVYDAEPA